MHRHVRIMDIDNTKMAFKKEDRTVLRLPGVLQCYQEHSEPEELLGRSSKTVAELEFEHHEATATGEHGPARTDTQKDALAASRWMTGGFSSSLQA
jgi:hypothetical protein